MFSGITKENHHHAYILEGERESIFRELGRFLEDELGVKTSGNPNLYRFETDTLSIDEVRAIREKDQATAFGGGMKVFIVAAHTIGREAQNALLKTLEEPNKDTIIFLIVPTKEALLPTVRSRAFLLVGSKMEEDDLAREEAERFVDAGLLERMKIISNIVEGKDKERAKRFLDALLVGYHARPEYDPEFLGEVLRAKNFLFDRAPSMKMLLEHLALTFPEQKEK